MLAFLATVQPAGAADTAPATPAPDAALVERASASQAVWSGVALAPDNRLFVVLQHPSSPAGPSLALLDADNRLIPYPDASWDGGQPAPRPARSQPAGPQGTGSQPAGPTPPVPSPDGPGPVFVGLDAIRLAPDGALWAVDTGIPGPGRAPVAGGARLIRIDLATNRVTRILPVPADALRPKSVIDDIRFNGDHAYVSDAGAPGLLVVDLRDGTMRRVLDRDPALTAQRPVVVDGEVLRGPDNKPAMIDAGRLEVSPDGRRLYLQPSCGPMSRIDTSLLDDPQTSPAALSAGVSFWYDTPALGGTAMAPDGTLYLADLENDSILALSADRVLTQVIRDPRLHGAGALFLSPGGVLFVPVPQLDRGAPFHRGRSQVQFPVALYTLDPRALLDAAHAGAAPPPGAPDASAPARR